MEDVTINCVTCPNEFIWTTGQQEFMNRLLKVGKIDKVTRPKRCGACRDKLKAEKESRELTTSQGQQGSKLYDDSEFNS